MVYCKAPVHDHFDARCLQARGYARVANPDLHPDQNGFDLDHGIEQRWYVLGAAEDIHDIDRARGSRGA